VCSSSLALGICLYSSSMSAHAVLVKCSVHRIDVVKLMRFALGARSMHERAGTAASDVPSALMMCIEKGFEVITTLRASGGTSKSCLMPVVGGWAPAHAQRHRRIARMHHDNSEAATSDNGARDARHTPDP